MTLCKVLQMSPGVTGMFITTGLTPIDTNYSCMLCRTGSISHAWHCAGVIELATAGQRSNQPRVGHAILTPSRWRPLPARVDISSRRGIPRQTRAVARTRAIRRQGAPLETSYSRTPLLERNGGDDRDSS